MALNSSADIWQRSAKKTFFEAEQLEYRNTGSELEYWIRTGVLDYKEMAEELEQLQNLRDQTRHLVKQLWEAARESESHETLLQPIKQYPRDLTQAEQSPRKLSLALNDRSHSRTNASQRPFSSLSTMSDKLSSIIAQSPSKESRLSSGQVGGSPTTRKPRSSYSKGPKAPPVKRIHVKPLSPESRKAKAVEKREQDVKQNRV